MSHALANADIRTLQTLAAAFAAGQADAPRLHVIASETGGIRRVEIGCTPWPLWLAVTGREAVQWQIDCAPFSKLEKVFVLGRQSGTVRRGPLAIEVVNLDPLGFGTPHWTGEAGDLPENDAFLDLLRHRAGLSPVACHDIADDDGVFRLFAARPQPARPAREAVRGYSLAVAVSARRAA